MHAPLLRWLAVAATAVLVGSGASETAPVACELPAAGADPLADRAGLLAEYERLPRACLDTIFHACSEAADQALLDLGSAATCSFGYEALLKKGFGGDFRRLMAWWRSERTGTVQSARVGRRARTVRQAAAVPGRVASQDGSHLQPMKEIRA